MTKTSSICDMTAVALRAEIAAGHLSARDVTAAHLARIDACNAQVNAVVTVDAEGALARATQADERQAAGHPLGLLHGLPIVHKDSFLTAGLRTTYAASARRGRLPWARPICPSSVLARRRSIRYSAPPAIPTTCA
ncbi:hypothetical protein G6F31_018440 [Rhizopus arrhizus]|nr:hypothetical protein G6F31_018440 [Rhizopus arrhizus]